jgi:hypothetical protein
VGWHAAQTEQDVPASVLHAAASLELVSHRSGSGPLAAHGQPSGRSQWARASAVWVRGSDVLHCCAGGQAEEADEVDRVGSVFGLVENAVHPQASDL